MYCAICGDEERLTQPIRYWSPDDGWRFGRFCPGCCRAGHASCRPRPDDYAYDQRGEYCADVDEAIDILFG